MPLPGENGQIGGSCRPVPNGTFYSLSAEQRGGLLLLLLAFYPTSKKRD